MATRSKLRGGVIAPDDESSDGIIELLTHHLRQDLDLVYYPHPFDLDTEQDHDFIIVLSLGMLTETVRLFRARGLPIPLIVHINSPAVLQAVSHRQLFPGVRVLPVPRALINAEPDVTLDLYLLEKIHTQMK